jgi:hypothetical protein
MTLLAARRPTCNAPRSLQIASDWSDTCSMASNGKGKGHLNGRAGTRAVPRAAAPVPKPKKPKK